MNESQQRGSPGSHRLLIAAAVTLAIVVSVIATLVLLRRRHPGTNDEAPAAAAYQPDPFMASDDRFARTNTVTVALGGDESGQGLRLVESEGDGRSAVETRDGVPARFARLADDRTTLYFYFQIHPAFKEQELSGTRIDVEFLAPQPGTIGVQYDAQDEPEVSNPVYREAVRQVKVRGSNVWQTASFRTQNDGLFQGRQNGRSDFRVWARAPELYVRRVSVMVEEIANAVKWTGDFSATNQLSILLGGEPSTNGLRHLADESDGRTQLVSRDGVMCRLIDRTADNKQFGYFYFDIAPGFKQRGLKSARVEVEYLAARPGHFRLQYDGEAEGVRRKYTSILPEGARVVRFGRSEYARIPTVGSWAVATFHVTNALFQNGQNGHADFRIEAAVPPELHVRRVTLTREAPR